MRHPTPCFDVPEAIDVSRLKEYQTIRTNSAQQDLCSISERLRDTECDFHASLVMILVVRSIYLSGCVSLFIHIIDPCYGQELARILVRIELWI